MANDTFIFLELVKEGILCEKAEEYILSAESEVEKKVRAMSVRNMAYDNGCDKDKVHAFFESLREIDALGKEMTQEEIAEEVADLLGKYQVPFSEVEQILRKVPQFLTATSRRKTMGECQKYTFENI